MNIEPESFWRPQVVRKTTSDGGFLYAIHEVHFGEYGKVVSGITMDSLSNEYRSIQELKENLISFLNSSDSSLVCGCKRYTYYKSDVEQWLGHIDDPVLDYKI